MPSMRMINEFMGKRTMKQLREERDILERKNAKLLAALEIYANYDSWQTTSMGLIVGIEDGIEKDIEVEVELGEEIIWSGGGSGWQIAKEAIAEAKGVSDELD